MKSIKCNEFFCVEFNIPEVGITIDVIVIALAECQISLCKVFTWMLRCLKLLLPILKEHIHSTERFMGANIFFYLICVKSCFSSFNFLCQDMSGKILLWRQQQVKVECLPGFQKLQQS